MLVIAQQLTAPSPFFLENKTENREKTTGTILKFQYLKKENSSTTENSFTVHQNKYVPLQSYKVLNLKIREQRLLPNLTFADSDLNNSHS